MEDIIHNRKLQPLRNDGLAAFVRLLAMLNQRKCRDGKIDLDPSQLQTMCGLRKRDAAERLARRLADQGLYSLEFAGDLAFIHVPKWSELQGLTPDEPQVDPDEPPAPTPTPRPTPVSEHVSSLDSGLRPKGDRKTRQDDQLQVYLDRFASEPEPKHKRRQARAQSFAKMFAAVTRVIDADQLESYVDVTKDASDDDLERATKVALGQANKGFPPSPAEVVNAWKEIQSVRQRADLEARRQARRQGAAGPEIDSNTRDANAAGLSRS